VEPESIELERKHYSVIFCGIFLSLIIHAGIFWLLIQLNENRGWIDLEVSFLEVNLVSQKTPSGEENIENNMPDQKCAVPGVKTASKKSSFIRTEKAIPPAASTEDGLRKSLPNNSAGEIDSIDNDIAIIPDQPSSGRDTGGIGFENHGTDRNGQIGSGMDRAGSFDSRTNYLNRVRYKIENQKKYPDAAQQRNIEGQVVVEFEIRSDGQISEPQVSKSSGNDFLDLAAVNAVKKASPFDSPPKQLFSEAIRINLPIKFELIR